MPLTCNRSLAAVSVQDAIGRLEISDKTKTIARRDESLAGLRRDAYGRPHLVEKMPRQERTPKQPLVETDEIGSRGGDHSSRDPARVIISPDVDGQPIQ